MLAYKVRVEETLSRICTLNWLFIFKNCTGKKSKVQGKQAVQPVYKHTVAASGLLAKYIVNKSFSYYLLDVHLELIELVT